MTDLSFEVTPIFITRLVDDKGGIMCGGAAQVGSVDVAIATRSVTSCRACSSSTPGLKIMTTEDKSDTDFERSCAMPGMPLSAFSRGTVTSDSTSAGDRPRQIVWISTLVGANSGNTSIGNCWKRKDPR